MSNDPWVPNTGSEPPSALRVLAALVSVLLMLLLLALARPAAAQRPAAADSLFQLRTAEGHTYIGVIVSETDARLVFETITGNRMAPVRRSGTMASAEGDARAALLAAHRAHAAVEEIPLAPRRTCSSIIAGGMPASALRTFCMACSTTSSPELHP